MNVIEISCPAKTFLIGEYAVLDGGPAIILNTKPRFTCQFKKNHKSNSIDIPSAIGIPSESPAGQWIKKNPHDFHCVQMEWTHDPKLLGNGLGFSSAQFNIVYAYSFILRDGHIDHLKPQEIWRSYRNLSFDGFKPSGADIITQWVGGLSIFEQNPLHVETLTSYLPDLECLVLKTGESFDTHKYLKEFEITDLSDLKQIAQSAITAIKQKKQDPFISAINEYRKTLINKGYVTTKSKELLKEIAKIKAIQAFKTCGAMGAETLVAFYNKSNDLEIREALSFLDIVASGTDLTYGLSFNKKTKKTEISS